MLRRLSPIALLVALTMMVVAGVAIAAPARRPERETQPPPEPAPGQTHDDPLPSPHGLALRGSHGFGVSIDAEAGVRGKSSRVVVRLYDRTSVITYGVNADLAGEGIRASLGRFGHIDLRWVPSGQVREVRGTCKGLRTDFYFATGEYVGSVDIRGANDFTTVTARRIPWRRRWYSGRSECPVSISEGMPGPGAILDAGHAANFYAPLHLSVVQNGAGARVSYGVEQFEALGRIAVTREAAALGGPGTITIGPGFRTGEISPPSPFSGSAKFERTEHATGTWLGDLAVTFPDGFELPLAGTAFEATLHSGYRVVHERF